GCRGPWGGPPATRQRTPPWRTTTSTRGTCPSRTTTASGPGDEKRDARELNPAGPGAAGVRDRCDEPGVARTPGDGPAAKGGVKANDLIVKLDGLPMGRGDRRAGE